jgi:hypothetical protein
MFSLDTTLARPHHVLARLPSCHSSCPVVPDYRVVPYTNMPHSDANEVIVTGTFDQALLL